MSDGRAERGPLYELVRERLGGRRDIELAAWVQARLDLGRSHLAALARLCAVLLREQNAQYKARQRLLSPAFAFFLELRDIELVRKAGFISESEIQEITAHRRSMKAQKAVERQRRRRSKKKSPRSSVT